MPRLPVYKYKFNDYDYDELNVLGGFENKRAASTIANRNIRKSSANTLSDKQELKYATVSKKDIIKFLNPDENNKLPRGRNECNEIPTR